MTVASGPGADGERDACASTGLIRGEHALDHSLFVANLPQRMTNEQLAVSMYSIFKQYGAIMSVKASRDQRGRPFGFVEYEAVESVSKAIGLGSQGHCIDGRRIRVEPAKRQRKLCIKQRATHVSLQQTLLAMKLAVTQHVREEDCKMSVQSLHHHIDANVSHLLGYAASTPVIAAVVKFEEMHAANRAYEQWTREHPDWSMTWITMDQRQCSNSNIRSSGLVQLVPSPDGNGLHAPMHIPAAAADNALLAYANTLTPEQLIAPFAALFSSPENSAQQTLAAYRPVYDEEHFDGTAAALADAVARECKNSFAPGWLYIGRLNSQAVTVALIHAHFAQHGAIAYIRLYNRNAIGADGVPIDAYAIVRYTDASAVDAVIEREHAGTWLGQTLKCEHALPSLLACMFEQQTLAESCAEDPRLPQAYHLYYYQPQNMYSTSTELATKLVTTAAAQTTPMAD